MTIRRSRIKQALWMLLGVFLLIPFCLLRAWRPGVSTINLFSRAPRRISEWKWAWLNTIYGNYEDGVSGAEALVAVPTPVESRPWPGYTTYGLYMPDAWAPWRAYCWSAWRNSTNALSRDWDSLRQRERSK